MAEHDAGELVLTYPELGDRLGISPDGARTKAKRAGWPIFAGNDGRSRVRVPAAELPEHPPSKAEHNPVTAELVTELKRSFAERQAELIGELERARLETERWRSTAEQNAVTAERERVQGELLREALERELDRVARLEALAARPWWRRIIGG